MVSSDRWAWVVRNVLMLAGLVALMLGSSVVRAATMTFPLIENNNWNLIVTLDGAAGSPTTEGKILYPTDQFGYQYNQISFQGEGMLTFGIRPEYVGPDELGTNELTATVELSTWPVLAQAGVATVSGTFNTKDVYGFSDGNSGYAAGFWVRVTCVRRAGSGDVIESTEARVRVDIVKFRHVFIAGGGFNWKVGGSNLRIKNDGTVERTPIDGESVHIQTDQPVSIVPSDPVLTVMPLNGGPENYPFGLADVWVESDLSNFEKGIAYPVIVQAGLADQPPFSLTLRLPYAVVEDSSGTVDRWDEFAGWQSAAGSRLYLGDRLRCTKTVDNGVIIHPWVKFRFASGHSYLIELTPNDFNESYYATITMGPDGNLFKSGVALTTALSRDFNDAKYAAQFFLREYVWGLSLSQAIKLGIKTVAPGSGWVMTQFGQTVGSYVVQRGVEAIGGSSNNAYQLANPDPGAFLTAYLEPASFSAAIPPGGRTVWTADMVTSLTGDKTLQVDNFQGFATVKTGSATRVVPPGGRVIGKVKQGGLSLGPLTLGGADRFGYGVTGGITIAPGDGQSVSTRTPQLTITLNGSSGYRPDTLVVRINGVAATSIEDRTGSGTVPTYVVKVSASSPLTAGANLIQAGCQDMYWGWTTAEATVYAPTAPPEAPRFPPRVLAGTDALLLSWDSSPLPKPSGYRLYAGATPDVMVAITPSNELLRQPIALLTRTDHPAIAGARYYAVTVVADGAESAKSPPVLAMVGGAVGSVPAAITNLVVTPVQDGLKVDFSPAVGAVAYTVERQAGGGSWLPWPNVKAVVAGAFVDNGVTRGTSYAYRITPLSISLQSGPVSTSTAQVATDLAPPAPTGLNAYQRYYGGKQMNIGLEWDPPSVPDVVGHSIWVSRDRGVWQRYYRLTGATRSFIFSLPSPGAYAFRITAHDAGGNESPASGIVGGGLAWRKSLSAGVVQLLFQ